MRTSTPLLALLTRMLCLVPPVALLSAEAQQGKFINPITDVCWKCLFPIHLGGVNITPGNKDYIPYKPSICACAGTPPKVGIPLAFWEPMPSNVPEFIKMPSPP